VGCHSDVDGWDVGDFPESRRVERVATYVRHQQNLYGAAFVSGFMSLAGMEEREEARRLLEERDII